MPRFADRFLKYLSFHVVLAIVLADDREPLGLSHDLSALLVELLVLAKTGAEMLRIINGSLCFLAEVLLHVVHGEQEGLAV